MDLRDPSNGGNRAIRLRRPPRSRAISRPAHSARPAAVPCGFPTGRTPLEVPGFGPRLQTAPARWVSPRGAEPLSLIILAEAMGVPGMCGACAEPWKRETLCVAGSPPSAHSDPVHRQPTPGGVAFLWPIHASAFGYETSTLATGDSWSGHHCQFHSQAAREMQSRLPALYANAFRPPHCL